MTIHSAPTLPRLTMAVLLWVASPLPVAGQGLVDVCRPLERPTVGVWARYRLRGGSGDSSDVRMALVGEDRVGDTDYFWLESVMSTQSGEAIIQSLVPADPYDPTAIRRAIVRMPGQAAMELPAAALGTLSQAGGGGSASLDACRRGEALGWETVEVPAGAVRALRVRYTRERRTAESWLAPGIPFALVRTVVTDDSSRAGPLELVLLSHGRDATPTLPLGRGNR